MNEKRCLWSRKRGQKLLPFILTVYNVDVKSHKVVREEFVAAVSPQYESKLINFLAYEKRFEKARLYAIGLAMVLLLVGQLVGVNSRTVYFVGLVLGITLMAFPFSDPRIYSLIGVRNAILLVRFVGLIMVIYMLFSLAWRYGFTP